MCVRVKNKPGSGMKKRKYPIRAGWRVGSVVALPLKDNNEHFNLVQTIYQLKCECLSFI